jgi:predicted metal-dependent phosphoesterase TrpH
MLAYLFDPADVELRALLHKTRTGRDGRLAAMTALIAEDYPITWEDVLAQVGAGATAGRPHLADALVAKGIVPDRSAAFASLLATSSPYFIDHWSPTSLDAIAAIRAAGGVPVIAHPGAVQRGGCVSEDQIAGLAAAGLAGIEADHRDHAPEMRARLRGLAGELGLFVTGSSDYHGAGKPNLLGEFTTTPEVLERIEALGALDVLRS